MLIPLGLARLVERSGAGGVGKRYPELWLNHCPGQIASRCEIMPNLAMRDHRAAKMSNGHDCWSFVTTTGIVAWLGPNRH
jgi:hypothetical protein